VDQFFELNINYRQGQGEDALLDVLRVGRLGQAPSSAQLAPLRARRRNALAEPYRAVRGDALWLTTTHADRRILNTAMLQELRRGGAPTIHVWSHHARSVRANGRPNVGMHGPMTGADRIAAFTTKTGETPGGPPKVEALLRLAMGARVCLTENDRNFARIGLTNGAIGTLVGLEYPTASTATPPQPGLDLREVCDMDLPPPMPIALVRFDTLAGGPNNLIVPIFPTAEMTVSTDDHGKFTRTGLPLRLARARTVHSAQGQTASQVVFLPTAAGTVPFAFGLAYVALSRVQTLDGLYILGHDLRAQHFTARNECAAHIDAEMARLRAMHDD